MAVSFVNKDSTTLVTLDDLVDTLGLIGRIGGIQAVWDNRVAFGGMFKRTSAPVGPSDEMITILEHGPAGYQVTGTRDFKGVVSHALLGLAFDREGNLLATGGDDVWVDKLGPDGQVLWSRSFKNTSDSKAVSGGSAVLVRADNSFYVAGHESNGELFLHFTPDGKGIGEGGIPRFREASVVPCTVVAGTVSPQGIGFLATVISHSLGTNYSLARVVL